MGRGLSMLRRILRGSASMMAGLFWLMSGPALAVAALPPAHGANSTPLRLLSWNIRLDTAADGADSWPYRAAGVIALLQQQQPDVIGLQEVLWHQLVRLESALTDYQRVGVGRDQGRADASETGEFSPLFFHKRRFSLLASGTFWLHPANQIGQPGGDAALPRICSWALLRDKQQGRLLQVLNLHLDHQGAQARREAIRLLGRYWQQQQPSAAALVVMGDFNPAPGDGVLSTLAQVLPEQQDVLAIKPAASGPAYSYYGWQQTPADGVRLDYLLVPPAQLQVVSAALLPAPRVQQPATARHSGRLSDHLPLQADLRWWP